MNGPSQRLIKKAERHERSTTGISLESIGEMECDDEIVADVFACIGSDDPTETRWGLWFCQGLLGNGQWPQGALDQLSERLPFLVKHSDPDVRAVLVGCLTFMRADLPRSRKWLIQFLGDDSPFVRSEALGRCETFLEKGEVEPLLSFQNDCYLMEVSMHGPVHYVLRNAALGKIELLLERQFPKHEMTEVIEGEIVFWWDWNPFLNWWSKKNRKWHFWKKK